MSLRRPLRWLLVLAVVLLVAIAWRATHEPESLRALDHTTAPIGKVLPSEPNDEGRPAAAIAHAHEQFERRAAARDLDRARRDALRERILERERTGAGDWDPARRAEPEAARDDDDDATAPGPGLVDRIGGRDALMAALNRDFMPLANECIEEATARTSGIQGTLAIEIDVVADPELGAVIDRADYPPMNEVHEAELLDCIRETALSTTLPPPPQGGRDVFMISMPIGDDAPRE